MSCLFLAISTGYRGTGYGADGVAVVLFCVIILALKCFPLGVRWDCAKESKVEAALRPLWTLFRGWPSERVRFTRRSALARVRRCVSVAAFCHRFTPAVCRMATNRTACDMFRSCSAGSRSLFVRSRGAGAVICLCWFTSGLGVSCRRSRRGCRGRGYRGRGERG